MISHLYAFYFRDIIVVCAVSMYNLRFESCSPLLEVQLVVLVSVGGLKRLLDVNDLLSLEGQLVDHVLVAL